jgi:NADH:ubiquinone oxidoreductase subunit 3 (subunit A)
MNDFLLTPPIAFVICLLVVLGLLSALSHLTFRGKRRTGGVLEPYACGEDIQTHMIQPNYGQFMHFAFFFTILHVVALTIATVPVKTQGALLFAILYILGAIVGLSVLYRR